MLEKTVFAGFGGQGTLLIGKFLACAGLIENKEVTWLPSYGPEMRGGTANCSVILSDRPVSSPVVDYPDAVIAMNLPSLLKFQNKIKPGGVLIVNSSLTDAKTSRTDITDVYVPATEIAERIGNPKGGNVVILGAYLALRENIVRVDAIIEAMREELGPQKAKYLDGNVKALHAGIDFARQNVLNI